MSTISIPQVFKDCGPTLLHTILEFSILTFTECDRIEALMVWLEHLEVIQWRLSMTIIAFICQAGRFDLVDSTAFVDVGCTLL